MRQDKYEKLNNLLEKLVDVALEEADPVNWPGTGWKPNELTKEQRGDRYWCKKNAVATLSLTDRVNRLIGDARQGSANGVPGVGVDDLLTDEGSLDADIEKAEKEAAKLLDQMTRAAAKKSFDQRVHGKT